MNKHLVLVGMMGSGKSSVAKWVRTRRGLPVYDIDAMIERREGRPVRAIFEAEGEARFRELERGMTADVLGRPLGAIATGGGLFIDAGNRRALLERGVVFYLQASAAELSARLAGSAHRPLFLPGADGGPSPEFSALLGARDPVYREAHHTVAVGGRRIDEIGEEILRLHDGETHG